MREPNAFWLGLELFLGGLILGAAVLSKKRLREWMLLGLVGLVLIVVAFTGIPTGTSVGQALQRIVPFAGVALWSALAVHFVVSARSKFNTVTGELEQRATNAALGKIGELVLDTQQRRLDGLRSELSESIEAKLLVMGGRIDLFKKDVVQFRGDTENETKRLRTDLNAAVRSHEQAIKAALKDAKENREQVQIGWQLATPPIDQFAVSKVWREIADREEGTKR